MNRILTLLILAVVGTFTHAEQPSPLPVQECHSSAPLGFPTSLKSSTTQICRKAYFVLHDNSAKIPQYVSYVLTPEHAVGCLPRSNDFAKDQSLADGAAPKDYLKSGYDMGHMANDGDMRWSRDVEEQSFILSNMVPQLPEFNRGIWKKLEDLTRGWAISRQHNLLIYVGPVYNKSQDKSIRNGVVIPHAFFKIIVDLETAEVQSFLFRHRGSKEPIESFLMSIQEIQRQTGLVFPLPETAKFGSWDVVLKSAKSSKQKSCSLN